MDNNAYPVAGSDPRRYERNVAQTAGGIIQPHVVPYAGATMHHQPQNSTVVVVVSIHQFQTIDVNRALFIAIRLPFVDYDHDNYEIIIRIF
jgi:hypothetical protein